MADPILIAAEYNAQAALNADAIASFATKYPLITVGAAFTDYNGLDWEYYSIVPYDGSVLVTAQYNDAVDGLVDYFKPMYAIDLIKAKFVYSDQFYTTATFAPIVDQVYFRIDMQFGDIVQITIDGGAPLIPITEFLWDKDDFRLTLLIPVSLGQSVDTIYKKAPYDYGNY